ncbi:MAG: aconitase [Geobacteraceae bacterium]|nr:aconitase [Geobacteraceae bacterium]
MAKNLTTKILEAHLVEGELVPGTEIAIKIDHALLQDATGTMAMLEFLAMGVPGVKVELAAQYIDHNLLQTDNRNADDHVFLMTAARKFGIYLSKPGNGVSHQVHLERFGVPGKTMLGADSHTPTAAGLAMLAIGAGGLDVALAMAGHPFYLKLPEMPENHGGKTDRNASGLGFRQGRNPGNAQEAYGQGWCRQDHRILRAGCRNPVGDRPGDNR